MYVYPRIGPWAHAETRNGVFRLGHEEQFVRQTSDLSEGSADLLSGNSQTASGQLWKDGGPVIGIQIENEYRDKGAEKGDEHIAC